MTHVPATQISSFMGPTRYWKVTHHGWLFGLALLAAGSSAGWCQAPSATDPAKGETFESVLTEGQSLFDLECYYLSENYFQDALKRRPDSQLALASLEKVRKKLAAEGEPSPERANTKKLVLKLGKIILPRVLFDRVRLADALEYLRCESIRLDTDPDSDHHGVEFIVQLSERSSKQIECDKTPGLPTNTPPPPVTLNSTVTLSLYQIPPFEASGYIAAQLGLKAKLHDGKIYLVGQNYLFPEEIITRNFHLSPAMLSRWKDRWGIVESTCSPDVIDKLWTAEGVTFPDGTRADYFPACEELIVHQTSDTILLVEAIFSGIR